MGDAESALETGKEVEILVQAAAARLWTLKNKHDNTSRLIWPLKRDGQERISEQESRLLFCQELEKSRWYYSLETPTSEIFQQRGTTPRSARIDLSLYDAPDHRKPIVNIEFKAHNPPVESFRKDLEKLLREKPYGVWFHILKGEVILERTFKSVKAAFTELDKRGEQSLNTHGRELLFAVCVLEPAGLFCGRLRFADTLKSSLPAIETFFSTDGARPSESNGWLPFPQDA